MNAIAQLSRLARLTTVLKKEDQLALKSFQGTDGLNTLFEFRVEAISPLHDADFDELLGTRATVELEGKAGPSFFDGIITEIHWRGPQENGYQYDLILRPWFWLAGKSRNQRIFHNMSAPDIIEEVLGAYSSLGNPHFERNLRGSYPVLEYTVQYRESDLDFCCRLMERFGISFHFTHDADGHTLQMTDSANVHDHEGDFPFYPIRENTLLEEQHLWLWEPARRVVTGSIKLTDFNFKTPTAGMAANHESDAKHPNGLLESYDYPGDYLAQNDGQGVASRRVEEERAKDPRIHAEGDLTALRAGAVFTLDGGDEVPGQKQDYICVGARYTLTGQSYGSSRRTESKGDGKPYTVDMDLMPVTAPMVPERKTPVPVVHGPQTAMVVGQGEIDCDEHGRIIVKFHWDIDGANSMRVRVSQNWASKGWGGMAIPRIGMEVIVEFLEGDPDKPIVTGCVYNGMNTPPYELPAHKTRTTFKTDTHGGTGYNELRFEDEKGKEEIFLHAQKDRNELTLNNHAERVKNNWTQAVENNKSIEVAKDHSEAVCGNMTLSVGPMGVGKIIEKVPENIPSGLQPPSIGVGVGVASAIMGALGLPTKPGAGNYSETIEVDKTVMVGKTYDNKVGWSYSLLVGKEIGVEAVGKYELTTKKGDIEVKAESGAMSYEAKKNYELKTDADYKVKSEKDGLIEIADELKIKVGKAEILMKKNGDIKIKGANILIDGQKISEKASGPVTIKGSKVDIN